MSSNRRNFPDGFDIDMKPLRDIMKRMDNFFNDSFKHMNSQFNLNNFRVDVNETEDNFIITAELAGYTREQIQLEIVGNRLRISVEESVSFEEENKDKHSYNRQQSIQRKERIVTLPFTIPENETDASFQNGLLTVIIPKQNPNRKFIDIE
ncbi:Hsp20/alpha crystallin family protein [Oceanobacillus bengalensis]|nr:Hsp20/alpha crystallin family protein [Oceanobacillus bengalensis]